MGNENGPPRPADTPPVNRMGAKNKKRSFPVREGVPLQRDGRVKGQLQNFNYMKRIHNRKYLEPYRKKLRKTLTPAEAFLWKQLQNKKLAGRKFRRQHSIENYIADFYCPEERLVVELDGQVHFNEKARDYDRKRTEDLNKLSIKVVRFENRMVFENLNFVLEEIKANFRN